VFRAVLITRLARANFSFRRISSAKSDDQSQSCHRHKVPPLRWTRIDWTRRLVDPERKSFRLFFSGARAQNRNSARVEFSA